MSVRKIDRRAYTCNACNFIVEVEAGDPPTAIQATGTIDFVYGNRHATYQDWWLCGDCARILDRFLCGDLKLDEDGKQLALLDDRFNDWWTEYCRMESALKSLGHDVRVIRNGDSILVEKGFRREDLT